MDTRLPLLDQVRERLELKHYGYPTSLAVSVNHNSHCAKNPRNTAALNVRLCQLE
jgi:hypothetical protein